MKCPDCKAEMESEKYPYTGYEYYICKACETQVRIIHGRRLKTMNNRYWFFKKMANYNERLQKLMKGRVKLKRKLQRRKMEKA